MKRFVVGLRHLCVTARTAVIRTYRQQRLLTGRFAPGLRDAGWLLYGLTRTVRPEVVVEIGSATGLSACYIAMALADNGRGRLYAIDPHGATNWNESKHPVDTYPIMVRNLERLHLVSKVEILRMTSQEAAAQWERPIDLAFIDGDHTYEGARHDWEAFMPHVTPFGSVVFHDTCWDISGRPCPLPNMGVPRFVEELRRSGYPVLTFTAGGAGVSVVQPVTGGISLAAADAAAAAATAPGASGNE